MQSDEQLTGCVRTRLEGILLLIDSHFRMAKHGPYSAVFLNSVTALLLSLSKPEDTLFRRYKAYYFAMKKHNMKKGTIALNKGLTPE